LIGDILDVVGVGLSARGGVNRQTRLENQMQLQRETGAKVQQAQGESGIAIQQAAKQADIDIAKARQLLPLQAQVALDQAIKTNDIETANRIFEENATVDAKTKVAVASAFGAKKAEIDYLRSIYNTQAGQAVTPATLAAQIAAKGNTVP
jgi:hypothetical protein